MTSSRVTRSALKKQSQTQASPLQQSSTSKEDFVPKEIESNGSSQQSSTTTAPSQAASSDPVVAPQEVHTAVEANTSSAPTVKSDQTVLYASRLEANAAEARRAIIRAHQAARYPHLAGTAEPNLNDAKEVRHFEVDAQGSLTFILLHNDEAWRLREVQAEANEVQKGQMIVGRYYVVERVGCV